MKQAFNIEATNPTSIVSKLKIQEFFKLLQLTMYMYKI
jgi:hypothetical protein